ncbi:MAG: GTP 3',8-cyclase MoaA [Eubacteriales bacterium]
MHLPELRIRKIMTDRFGREITYMRISITDRCNLRCRYCMPEDIPKLAMSDIMTFEEIRDVVSAASLLGITDVRITGGEPLVRKGCPGLVAMLKSVPGIRKVAMTTNGILLGENLQALLDAGLDSVNVSLDSLDREKYRFITGSDRFSEALDGIRLAEESGIPVKINVVLQQGINAEEWPQLAGLAENHQVDVRFIEMMPIGFGKKYQGVPNDELIRKMKKRWPDIEEDPAHHGSGPAHYMKIPAWKGSIGFISAIHGKFCSSCNRIRLTSTGKLKPCLCYGETVDLMPALRGKEGSQKSPPPVKRVVRSGL